LFNMVCKMHARIRADEDMPSHFWVMATARAESIVPLPQRHIMCPVAECPEMNLEYHSQYRGEAGFNAAVRAEKLTKIKPMGEMLLLGYHVLVCSTITKMSYDAWL